MGSVVTWSLSRDFPGVPRGDGRREVRRVFRVGQRAVPRRCPHARHQDEAETGSRGDAVEGLNGRPCPGHARRREEGPCRGRPVGGCRLRPAAREGPAWQAIQGGGSKAGEGASFSSRTPTGASECRQPSSDLGLGKWKDGGPPRHGPPPGRRPPSAQTGGAVTTPGRRARGRGGQERRRGDSGDFSGRAVRGPG